MAAENPERRKEVRTLKDQGVSVREIALRFGISTQAVYQMLGRIERGRKASA